MRNDSCRKERLWSARKMDIYDTNFHQCVSCIRLFSKLLGYIPKPYGSDLREMLLNALLVMGQNSQMVS